MVNWTSVGVSTLTGAIGGGIGGLLAKQGVGLAARTAITAGAEFNLGYWGQVAENKITGKEDVFEGALLSGALGGLAGAGGELISTGIGAAWSKYPRLDRIGKQLDNMADETQDLIRQLDELQARSTPGNNPNRFEPLADPWSGSVNSPVRSNPASSFDPHPTPSNIPDGWMQMPDGSIVASPSRMLPGSDASSRMLPAGAREYSNPELLKWKLAEDAGIPQYIDLAKPDNVIGMTYEQIGRHYELHGYSVEYNLDTRGNGRHDVIELVGHPRKEFNYHSNVKSIQLSKGDGNHGPSPYYKFKLTDNTEIKVLENPNTFNPNNPPPSKKHFNRYGQPLQWNKSTKSWEVMS
jgi:hypothetical protein